MSDNIWVQEASSGQGGVFETCPAGNHPGTIVALFDVGTHDSGFLDKNGNRKWTRYLFVAIELVVTDSTGKPFVMLERYSWSMHSDSKWRELVEALVGRKFSDGEQFDPRTLVGRPVLASVIHEAKGDKTYHRVSGLSGFPAGFPAPIQTLGGGAWSVMTGDPFPASCVAWLPRHYGEPLDQIAAGSQEVRSRAGQGQTQAVPAPVPVQTPVPAQVDPVRQVLTQLDQAATPVPAQWGQTQTGKLAF